MTDNAAELTATIVAAFVTKQRVAAADLPHLIDLVHRTLANIDGATADDERDAAPLVPAISIRRSVTPDYVICLEDGKRFKSIKRHLQTAHGMDPPAYRAKWGLKKDYRLVAENYSAQRSTAAKAIGLGQGGRTPAQAQAAPAPEPETVTSVAKRVRRPKAATPEA